jgi:DNA-binding CsgD family transcriptional regulator
VSKATDYGLTPRELEVLHAACDGETESEAASRLYVSRETVKTYKTQLFRKLGAKNIAHAVAIAYHVGVLEVPIRGRPFMLSELGDCIVRGRLTDGRLLLELRDSPQ